jgi:protein-tyrosine phosphatase
MKVLFVCMGNICRSPTAHGVFFNLLADRDLLDDIAVDSAGTHAYHSGEPPDKRAQAATQKQNIDISPLRARQVTAEDFVNFDFIIGMDNDNMRILRSKCPHRYQGRLHLLMDFAPDEYPDHVPDPYYGGVQGFDQVLEMVTVACENLLNHIQKKMQGQRR